MALFKSEPPRACPKCRKADGWRCIPSDAPHAMDANAAPVNAFTSNPACGSIGASLTSRSKQSKQLLYHCDLCGFEKSF